MRYILLIAFVLSIWEVKKSVQQKDFIPCNDSINPDCIFCFTPCEQFEEHEFRSCLDILAKCCDGNVGPQFCEKSLPTTPTTTTTTRKITTTSTIKASTTRITTKASTTRITTKASTTKRTTNASTTRRTTKASTTRITTKASTSTKRELKITNAPNENAPNAENDVNAENDASAENDTNTKAGLTEEGVKKSEGFPLEWILIILGIFILLVGGLPVGYFILCRSKEAQVAPILAPTAGNDAFPKREMRVESKAPSNASGSDDSYYSSSSPSPASSFRGKAQFPSPKGKVPPPTN